MDQPICDVCGETVVATICGVKRPRSPKTEQALYNVILAAHKRLAHETTRRYDGRTEHTDWCRDHNHDGKYLDRLLEAIGYDDER